jgi:hypothetical protein
MQEKPERNAARKWFRFVIYSSPVLWAVLALASILLPIVIPTLLQNVLCIAFVVSLDIWLIYKKIYKDWNDCKPISMKFNDYFMKALKI